MLPYMETFSFKSYMVMNLYVPAQELQAVVEQISLPTLDNLKIGG